jgi:hypothetical protein
VAYHKWSNPKLTLDDYKAILNCHLAQFKATTWHNLIILIIWLKKIFGLENILKNPNDVMCCILKLPRVNKLLVCIVLTSVLDFGCS